MASSWWSQDTVAVVTGANRGLGLKIVRQLAEKGLTVILTARGSAKGQAAVDNLHAKGLKKVVFHQLDTSDPESVQKLSSWLKIEYGWIDILRLKSESIKELFRDEDKYSKDLADKLAAKFLEDRKAGGAAQDGWLPRDKLPIYGESKMFLNVYTIGLAKAFSGTQADGREIFIAGMCPGATDTELIQDGKNLGWVNPVGYPLKTIEDGADTAVWLAPLPKGE